MSSAPDPQAGSLLFARVPLEIRRQIFSEHFHATKLAWGIKVYTDGSIGFRKPRRNSVALLRICRRARWEIGDTWIGQVQFIFEHAERMLEKLNTLSPGIISSIRHLRVFGGSLLFNLGDSAPVAFPLAAALKLLPGLRLDTLTVLGTCIASDSYIILTTLISESCGWRTLRFINYSLESRAFSSPSPTVHPLTPMGLIPWEIWETPKLAHWQTLLEDRDGTPSSPSVVIHRSPMSHRPGSVPKEPGSGEPTCSHWETMVVVKRGHGVDYEVKTGSPVLGRDRRWEMPGDWDETRAICIDHMFFKAAEKEGFVDWNRYLSCRVPPSWLFLRRYSRKRTWAESDNDADVDIDADAGSETDDDSDANIDGMSTSTTSRGLPRLC